MACTGHVIHEKSCCCTHKHVHCTCHVPHEEIVVVVNRIACSFPGYFYVKLPLKDNNVITCMLVQSGMCQLYLYSSALQPQIETLEIRRWLRP